jgi:cysteine desulfurase
MNYAPKYFDYAATTPVDSTVAQRMCECLTQEGNFGNPASRSHIYGWRAEEAVEEARNQTAQLLNADPREIVWTSGATESNNLAIKGIAQNCQAQGRHLITSIIEHKSVIDVCRFLETQGFQVTWLRPNSAGEIQPEQVIAAMQNDTILVSLMHVNNELGVITDVAKIGGECRQRGIVFHVDAAQSAGKIPLDVNELKVDLLSLSAHKFYGPKGSGALYVRRSDTFKPAPLLHGGGHERGMRSGTLATHQIVGLGEAAKIAQANMLDESKRIQNLSERFLQQITQLPGVQLNTTTQSRIPGIVNLGFADVDGENLLLTLRDLALSTGSACTSASLEPSYVLQALGIEKQLAQSSLRFSFGRYTTSEDIDFAIDKISTALHQLRRPVENIG